MKDQYKTKKHLIEELEVLRKQLGKLKKVETKHKRAEDALKKSEDRYKRLVESSPVIVWSFSQKRGTLFVSSRVKSILGYTPDFLYENPWLWNESIHPDDRYSVAQSIKDFASGKDLRVEYRIKDSSGNWRWFYDRSISMYMEGPEIIIEGISIDMTERKHAEEALKKEKDRAKKYLDIAGVMLIAINTDQKVILINKKGREILGYEEKEIIDKNWFDHFVPEQNRERVKGVFSKLVASEIEPVEYFENSVLTKSGMEKIIAWHNTIIRDENGHIMGTLSSGEDVTEHKKVEETLKESEKKYRQVVENATEIIYTTDIDGNFRYANPSALKVVSYSLEELQRLNYLDLVVPEYRDQLKEIYDSQFHGRQATTYAEFPFFNKFGEVIWFGQNASLMIEGGRIIGFEVIARDITERKRAEEALRESEERYRTLVETSPDAITLLDLNLNIVMANRPALALYGYESPEEVVGQSALNFIAPEDRPRAVEDVRKMLETGSIGTLEYTLLRKGGVPFSAELRASMIVNVEKKPLAYICISRDITERKKAEEALKKSEEKFKELYDDAPIGYFEYNTDECITSVNRTELEMLGYSVEEMIGQPPWKFIVEEDIARQRILDVLAGIMPPARGLERTCRRKDGTTFPALIQDRLLQDAEGKILGIRGTIQDITDRKRAEEEKVALVDQLRQSQKMEAIGRLAGGVAHDFNNLLTVIKGYCQLSLVEMKEGNPLREAFEVINKATEKAADLTRQLLAFSRRQIMEMRVLDLNSLLQDLDKMLRRIIGEDIELVTLLGEDLGRVKTDPGQIEQVVMNLAVNAKDSMPKGGKLIIETANVELDEAYAHAHVAVTPGRYVMIAVSDTGAGMAPEVRDRVFEPFFTTKEKGKGTGLGLSTVYGIVKQSSGNIWVYSEPGKGTTFKIYLPHVDEPAEELKEKVVGEELPRGSETILIVEDDEEVRNLAVRILKAQGYIVLDGSDGDEALNVCRKHKGPIHLLVTDVVMPGMDGRALSERLSHLQPEMKVLYMSGYTEDAIIHHGVMGKGMNYIQKPFTVNGLTRKVREVLDQSRQH